MSTNIQLVPGATGIKSAYADLLKEKSLDIVCLSENYTDVIGDYFDREYSPKLFSSDITTREILPDTKENRATAQKKSRKNSVRFLKSGKSESDFIVAKNKVILISFNSVQAFALVIHDAELVKSFQYQFENLWNSLS